MPFRMQPAKFPAGGFPEATERKPGSDQTYPTGTPVTWSVSTQELDACADDPTGNILGVSLEGVVSGKAQNPSGNVAYAKANRTNIFVAKAIDGSGNEQTVSDSFVGVSYGLKRIGTGLDQWWGVNVSDTTNPVVKVVEIDKERNVVFFKFLEGAIQEN